VYYIIKYILYSRIKQGGYDETGEYDEPYKLMTIFAVSRYIGPRTNSELRTVLTTAYNAERIILCYGLMRKL